MWKAFCWDFCCPHERVESLQLRNVGSVPGQEWGFPSVGEFRPWPCVGGGWGWRSEYGKLMRKMEPQDNNPEVLLRSTGSPITPRLSVGLRRLPLTRRHTCRHTHSLFVKVSVTYLSTHSFTCSFIYSSINIHYTLYPDLREFKGWGSGKHAAEWLLVLCSPQRWPPVRTCMWYVSKGQFSRTFSQMNNTLVSPGQLAWPQIPAGGVCKVYLRAHHSLNKKPQILGSQFNTLCCSVLTYFSASSPPGGHSDGPLVPEANLPLPGFSTFLPPLCPSKPSHPSRPSLNATSSRKSALNPPIGIDHVNLFFFLKIFFSFIEV